jgi:hypothetical protein
LTGGVSQILSRLRDDMSKDRNKLSQLS